MTVQYNTVHDNIIVQYNTGYDETVQDRIGQIRAGNNMTWQDSTIRRTGQDRTGQDRI